MLSFITKKLKKHWDLGNVESNMRLHMRDKEAAKKNKNSSTSGQAIIVHYKYSLYKYSLCNTIHKQQFFFRIG